MRPRALPGRQQSLMKALVSKIILGLLVSVATIEAFLRFDSMAQALGWVNVKDIGVELKVSLSPVEAFNSCCRVARDLLKRGYYSGLLSAIRDCESVESSFLVIDCPSGTGKTLAGIALRELDCRHRDNLGHIAGKAFRVVHAVWPRAVISQAVYRGILQDQLAEGVNAEQLLERAKIFLDTHTSFASRDDKIVSPGVVWKEILRFVFNLEDGNFGPEDFERKVGLNNGRLIIFIDEVPTGLDDVHFIGSLRDLLKAVPTVLVILSGTHAMAANIIGTSNGAASRHDVRANQPWSLLFTRLPGFGLEVSGLARTWNKLQWKFKRAPRDESSGDILKAIDSSIRKHGNPWLVYQAMAALEKLIADNHEIPSFDAWQRMFSSCVYNAKFRIPAEAKWSSAFSGLVAQLNLLLEGSSSAELSDVLIGEHFAYRSVPELGHCMGTQPRVDFCKCGGWLYLASARNKTLRLPLFFCKGAEGSQKPSRSLFSWQTTVFPSVSDDILVYLSSCRDGGYFMVRNTASIEQKFDAHEIVLNLWSKNSVGAVNFQNPRAIVNSGSLLEILLATAAMNAAASFTTHCARLPEFLVGLIRQLGVRMADAVSDALRQSFSADKALLRVRVPRCLFPGVELPDDFSETIGLVQRVANRDRYDLLIRVRFGEAGGGDEPPAFIRLEAKDRLAIGNQEMAAIAGKLVRGHGEVGVLAVRNCCGYWDGDGRSDTNRRELAEALRAQPAQSVGEIYFVGCDGELSILRVGDQLGRMVVVKVPETSLRME